MKNGTPPASATAPGIGLWPTSACADGFDNEAHHVVTIAVYMAIADHGVTLVLVADGSAQSADTARSVTMHGRRAPWREAGTHRNGLPNIRRTAQCAHAACALRWAACVPSKHGFRDSFEIRAHRVDSGHYSRTPLLQR